MVRACAVAGIKAEAPFPHMQYKDVIRKYGSDKPDMRFGMELHDVSEHFAPERIEGERQLCLGIGGAVMVEPDSEVPKLKRTQHVVAAARSES